MDEMLTFKIDADEVDIFLQDVNENLQALETGILSLERAADLDTLNAAFRAAHTIKAVVATVGHRQMAEITHALETLFDAMRNGELSSTQVVTDELLATVDALKALRDEVVTREPSGVDVETFLARLRTLVEDETEGVEEQAGALAEQSLLTPEQIAQMEDYEEEGMAVYEIEATTRANAFAQGARLLQASMALMKLGHIVTQRPSQADLAEGQHSGHLWLILATQDEPSIVEDVLDHIIDLAEFWVLPYGGDGDLLQADLQTTSGEDAADSEVIAGDLPAAQEVGQRGTGDQTVRISVERLDALMNLVGELVTDRTRLTQIQETMRVQYGKDGVFGALNEMSTHFERVVDQLQEEVMAARMLPISYLFRKFPRLVRDVARAGGKQVNLIVEGEATELDRSVIEAINDPLIHLLRNAVDHGIESSQERIAAGKPPNGTVWLTAAHEEGHIVVTVKDNGRGIDPKVIRRTAVERGLLSEDEAAQLDDEAAINLIFQPNLSTADEVTNMSGRGVGLDVVRTNIKRLSGSVVVESEVGRGTTFRITLPLTLAILQAMLIALGDDVYAIPLSGIVESLYLSEVDVGSVKGRSVIKWRDQVLPLVDLHHLFHQQHTRPVATEDQRAVVIVSWGRIKVGLVVDGLVGKQEIVIKSLGTFIGSVMGLSGCTILGDGRIALIVDVPGLIGTAMKVKSAAGFTG